MPTRKTVALHQIGEISSTRHHHYGVLLKIILASEVSPLVRLATSIATALAIITAINR